jgi:hypothetical protein
VCVVQAIKKGTVSRHVIELDIEQFMTDGYLILRGAISPEELEPLRESAETAVRRCFPEGIPEGMFQPLVKNFNEVIDEATANLIEMFMHEATFGVASRLMPDAKAVAPAGMFLMCNPVQEHGPWFWHRDINPETKGPLVGLQQDMLANGPVYLHFNIALYDDDVYWVVPGSHRRVNTDEENRQLLGVPHGYAHGQQPQGEKRHEPLPNSISSDLKAGDLIVNHLELLHWASDYGTRLRRTFHIGYRSFGGPSFFYEGYSPKPAFGKYLSPASQAVLAQCDELYDEELDRIEAVLRAVLARDSAALASALAELHPGETGRFMALIHVCKDAQQMHQGVNAQLAERFTSDDIETLWQSFVPLDEALQSDVPDDTPAFQVREPSGYRLNEMPDYGVEDFVASWKQPQTI